MLYPQSVDRLIDQFARLPGIGRKTAVRLAFRVLSMPVEEAGAFAEAIVMARERARFCAVCQNLTDDELCGVCSNENRDKTTVCVVAEARDAAAVERSREYKGVYHVLHGVISPMNAIGPDEIRVRELLSRVSAGGITEVILATNADTEGDTTAMYIARLLSPFDVKVTRLAYGIPMGGHLEYADELTLTRAIEGRTPYNVS